jgi:hypothetical protein
MPDCLALIRYRNCPGIVGFFYFGTGLIGCRTVQHLYIQTRTRTPPRTRTHTYDVWHEHGQKHGCSAWTWTYTIDMEIDKYHEYRNADKKFSLASLVFR